ncbi:MAG: sigma factor, partial [Nocardioidaceae bacterium]
MAPSQHWDADEAVTRLYVVHYRSLVRLAALLVRNNGEAEEIVQDAFVAMHDKWRRLRDPDKAVAYMRQTVVNRARSSLRRHQVAEKHTPRTIDNAASAEEQLLTKESRAAVIAALHQ